MKHVVIIGAGFAGLSASCYLAKMGYRVTVVDKNEQVGGRARTWKSQGFRFDMGPSWYWMPDIFEDFFRHFDKKPTDYYQLTRLDPGYKIFFDNDDTIEIPANPEETIKLFDTIEPGSGEKLKKLLERGKHFYKVGMYDYTRRPSLSPFELFDAKGIWEVAANNMIGSFGKEINSLFSDHRLRKIVQFPVLFLGSYADKLPSMYSLMNYSDMVLGTWHVHGGIHEVAKGMATLAHELGVEVKLDTEVSAIRVEGNEVTVVDTISESIDADIVIGAGDYHHIEQQLLPKANRRYDEHYWNTRTMSPSSVLFFLGINTKIPNLLHHNLLFDEPFEPHMDDIYSQNIRWTKRPLMYINLPSKTDKDAAPEGYENIFVLIPSAPGLEEKEHIINSYFDFIVQKIEMYSGVNILPHLIVHRSYSYTNFVHDYNSYKGNTYGLANSLSQTGPFKPKIKAKGLTNMYFAGQLTVPGPGVPPSLISGEVVSRLIHSDHGQR